MCSVHEYVEEMGQMSDPSFSVEHFKNDEHFKKDEQFKNKCIE